ncbi:malonate transporter subunit MadM [Intestinibacter sp.]
MLELLQELLIKNGLVFAFLIVAAVMFASTLISKYIFKGKIAASAVAIIIGLILAYIGGIQAGGEKGISDVALFAGMGTLGGSMFRDLTIVSTACGADLKEIVKAGKAGIVSLLLGIIIAFIVGAGIAYIFGYNDAASMATIGGGACTFVVGPVVGAAFGVASDVVAISIAAGVIKSVLIMVVTPFVAKMVGLNNPQSAMIYGGLMGSTSGVAAGLAATDEKLVPYGAMVATFYTGLGCLLCPSILYMALSLVF